MRRVGKKGLGALSVLFIFFFFSCKPKPVSSVQTLDNFAAGERLRTNECVADPQKEVDFNLVPAGARILPPVGKTATANQTLLRKDVLKSLSVIPREVQDLFVAMGGQILITDNANGICTDHYKALDSRKYLKDGLEAIQSCAVFFAAKGDREQVFNVVVAPDQDEIRHGIPRVFGAIIAEMMAKMEVEDGKLEMTGSIPEDLFAASKTLASHFLYDMNDVPDFPLSNLEYLFGTDGLADIEQLIAKTEQPIDLFNYLSFDFNGTGTDSDNTLFAREDRVLSFILAESFDSYFCNTWGAFDEQLAKDIKAGRQPITRLAELKHTREVMRVIFPRSYKQFSEQLWPKYSRHMKNLLADLNVDGYSRSLSLWWGSSSSKSSRSSSSYESPAWAGTKAFFGSVWDNTGGAVGRAYNSYSDQVGKAVDEVYDGNIATTTAKAIGKVGADNYQAYYDRKYEQTSRRIETMQQGGMDPTTAQRYGVGLAVGDVIGVTDIAEGVGGYEVENARKLSGYERTMKVVQGTGQVAGTAAGVVGATGRVSSMIAGSADDVARAGVTSRVVNGLCLAGNQIDPAPYTQANGRLNVPKPAYNNPGTHDPTSPNFNKTKSVLPDDAQAMFRKAVPDPGSLRSGINPSTGQSEVYAKNWYSKANDGSIYRFQTDEFGKAHYNGRTGDPSRAIKDADIPKGVKSRLGPAGKPPC